jgi:hypothetical protein
LTVRQALIMAWRNNAPKRLAQAEETGRSDLQ